MEMDIVVLRLVKTKGTDGKNRKCIMTYGVKGTPDTPNVKGFMICEQWFDSPELFDSFTTDMLGVPLHAKYSYKLLYNGQARMNIDEFIDNKGNCILA